DHDPHNAVWASRYHQLPVPTHDLSVHEEIYRQNIRFLDACQKLSEQEKEAEQMRMEEKSRLQREEELRLQKEKSQRRMLGVLTAGMFLAILLAMWAFNSKSQAMEQKNKALLLAEELRTQKKLADNARRSAVIERDRANALAQKVALQRDSLRVANESIEAKKDRALRLQAIITKQNAVLASQKNVLAKQIVEHNLHEEPFYRSPYMEENSKEAFVDALFREPLTKHEEVPYADYINLDLLHELNQAIAARELFARNPVAGLRSARQMWRDKKLTNGFVRQLLFQIFERNIFQAQRIDPSLYQRSEEPGEPVALSATEGARFAFANRDQLITGRFANDSVLIDNVLWAPEGGSNQQAQNQMNAAATTYATGDILAVKVLEKDALLSLDRNGKVFWHKGRARQFLGKMPDSNPWIAAFSPSGKRLAVVSQAGTLELWTIDSVRSNRSFLTDTLINENRNNTIRQLQFSPDERLLLVQYSDNSFEVWDLPQKKRSSKYGRSR
ncbi:MAG TPA: hypothetical protein VFL47_16075, partial [Flavisolibacter sp.]|nr:hypothetical protein [Flavisolibacter sp.]